MSAMHEHAASCLLWPVNSIHCWCVGRCSSSSKLWTGAGKPGGRRLSSKCWGCGVSPMGDLRGLHGVVKAGGQCACSSRDVCAAQPIRAVALVSLGGVVALSSVMLWAGSARAHSY